MSDTVLIVTNDHDEHADAVIVELNRRDVPVFRFHPEDFPHSCSVSIEIRDGRIGGELRNADHRVAFDDICAAWYRRSRNLYMGAVTRTSEKLDDYVKAQSTATVVALCASLETLWVSHPFNLRRGEVKALQLAEAARGGQGAPTCRGGQGRPEDPAYPDRQRPGSGDGVRRDAGRHAMRDQALD